MNKFAFWQCYLMWFKEKLLITFQFCRLGECNWNDKVGKRLHDCFTRFVPTGFLMTTAPFGLFGRSLSVSVTSCRSLREAEPGGGCRSPAAPAGQRPWAGHCPQGERGRRSATAEGHRAAGGRGSLAAGRTDRQTLVRCPGEQPRRWLRRSGEPFQHLQLGLKAAGPGPPRCRPVAPGELSRVPGMPGRGPRPGPARTARPRSPAGPAVCPVPACRTRGSPVPDSARFCWVGFSPQKTWSFWEGSVKIKSQTNNPNPTPKPAVHRATKPQNRPVTFQRFKRRR